MSKDDGLMDILEKECSRISTISAPFIKDEIILDKVQYICRFLHNRAPVRFLLSCIAGKISNPQVDIRRPYTEIRLEGTFSGRYYDEKFIQVLIHKYKLPCNATTAYLTPALRNLNVTLTPKVALIGRPKELYQKTLEVLNEAYNYLNSKNASRLPVLVVAAAYRAVSDITGEQVLPLKSHNAADKQTKSIGDIEIVLKNDNNVVTVYEMKAKQVTKVDLEVALKKLFAAKSSVGNYIFITTDKVEEEVTQLADQLYKSIGVEVAILDCMQFLRHFLHFFHRSRNRFLGIYQEMLLKEPASAVSQLLKEKFLSLRKTAEHSN